MSTITIKCREGKRLKLHGRWLDDQPKTVNSDATVRDHIRHGRLLVVSAPTTTKKKGS